MVYIFFIKISFHFPLKIQKERKKMSSLEMQTILASIEASNWESKTCEHFNNIAVFVNITTIQKLINEKGKWVVTYR